jgi:uncharacterized protein YigA (DUF484 family)
MSDAGQSQDEDDAGPGLEWPQVRDFLLSAPDRLKADGELLGALGLRLHHDNVVAFPALARQVAAHERETGARKKLEAVARANFAAQAQTHAAVVDLLDSRNHADLARRLDEIARLRFGLTAAVIGIEAPGRAPAGWRALPQGSADRLLGPQKLARMGEPMHSDALFGEESEQVKSVAMVRLAIWTPARQGVLAFGSREDAGFAPDMGAELVAFLARVVERTAERWPVF